MEIEAKVYVAREVKRKECVFNVKELSNFFNQRFAELFPNSQLTSIRSESSLRLDLHHWGFTFKLNGKRPYFEGHERHDVIEHRTKLIDYFISRKEENYYTVEKTDKLIKWIKPTERPCVLFFHDESTFRSGEQSNKRWFGQDPVFFNKGRGQSWMISDFLVAHPNGPFFMLNEEEFSLACIKYPSLATSPDVIYEERSCTGGIEPGKDAYFSSATVERQFERLCQMLEFKNDFNVGVKHQIEVIFDNSTTHTKLDVNINDFR